MAEAYLIDELAEQAANALVATGTVPPSGRVSALPDRRMLRYYTTIGLLDRPAEIRGRTAYYGRRHLLQIVAIKRLQAAGATLAEVQHRLAGASTAYLERIANVPSKGAPAASSAANGAARRTQFWRAAAAPADAAATPDRATTDPIPSVPTAIRLATGVTLVVDAARPMSPADHEAARAAALPLLDHLTARGLLAAEQQER